MMQRSDMGRVLDLVNEISHILGEKVHIMYLSRDPEEKGGDLVEGANLLIVRERKYLEEMKQLAEDGEGRLKALVERTLH